MANKYFIAMVLLLATWLGQPVTTEAQNSTRKKNLEAKRRQLQSDISNTTEMLNKTRAEKRSAISQVSLINSRLEKQKQLLENFNQELDEIDVQLSGLRDETGRLGLQYARLQKDLSRILLKTYLMRSSHSKLLFLFSAKNFNQVLFRRAYLNKLAHLQKVKMDKIKATRGDIDQKINDFETARREKETLTESQKLASAEAEKQLQEKNKMVSDLKKKEGDLRAQIKKSQRQANDLDQQIEAMIKAEIQRSQQKKNVNPKTNQGNSKGNKNKPASTDKPVYIMDNAEAKLSNSFIASKGSLPWPVKGVVTGYYGEHPHPVLSNITVRNNGIDITASSASVVSAVYDGTVSGVISLPNGKKAVLIRHGEYLSVYSNLGSCMVSSGKNVSARQTIGNVGYDNDQQAYILHFEIRKEKNEENPLNWLAR